MEYLHKKLIVWQKSMQLANCIYDVTETYPSKENFGLVNQMRRAAVSIPSNIAEGRARSSDKDFIRFLLIARGSCAELDTQILLSEARGYLTKEKRDKVCSLCVEVSRCLTGLIESLKQK
jgi:four helix bundle protein